MDASQYTPYIEYSKHISDSSPSCDDSHKVLHLMPKKPVPEIRSFRHLPLSAAFPCVWRIRLPTLETCNLYLLLLTIASMQCLVKNSHRYSSLLTDTS